MFWNDFNRQSLAMSVRWYIWSFGFCSVAKKYDSQIVLKLTVYRKSMALYSYFVCRVLYSFGVTLGRKKKIYIKISKVTM